MSRRVKLGKPLPTGRIPSVAEQPATDDLRFSFKHFYQDDKFSLECCKEGYLHKFLERLKSLSTLTVREFRYNKSSAIRAHQIDFNDTTQPGGFYHLNEQLRASEAWQFQITANEHGRVHGILLRETFYVVWIDAEHKLYP